MSPNTSPYPNAGTPQASRLLMTTLYDLMMVLNAPGSTRDTASSTALVVHWINNGRIRFVREYARHRVVCT
jgi:hypothetical protein